MPQDGKGRAFVRDPENHHVQGRVTEVPVGAVKRDDPRRAHCDQTRDKDSHLLIGHFKEPEEELNPLIVRLLLGTSGKHSGDFGEVDGSDFDQRHEKLCQKVDAGTIPSYILPQHSSNGDVLAIVTFLPFQTHLR